IELKRPGEDAAKSVSIAQKVIHAAHARQGSLTWLFNDSDKCIEFITYIAQHAKLFNNDPYKTFADSLYYDFKEYISPFAVGTMYEQYLSEYEQWVAKQKEQRKKRSMRH
ncbi:MAG: hypothetical protein V4506_14435, partial [Bacteroidota bacterium]